MIDEGVDLSGIRDVMGHAYYRLSLKYARIKKDKLWEAARVRLLIKWRLLVDRFLLSGILTVPVNLVNKVAPRGIEPLFPP
jgi:hypothetical protein